jgi:fatty-acid peroxygenase
MAPIPRDHQLDSTLALLSDGYTFISRRCRRYDSDLFETRLMLQKVICMMGEEAASVFYHANRFTRIGAMPKTALRLLQDTGSVALLDGKDHRWRKQMFMSLMTPGGIQQLSKMAAEQWHAAMSKWETQDRVVLLPEVQEILYRAVCMWTGVPLDDSEVKQRTREIDAMIDGSGAFGPRNWRGTLLWVRTERWLQKIIKPSSGEAITLPKIHGFCLISMAPTMMSGYGRRLKRFGPSGLTTGMAVHSTSFPKAGGIMTPITAVRANGSRSNS